VLRASGTEPVIRVMIEGEDRYQVSSLASLLADTVRERFGGER
jgi:phosphoglucosamine mutase